MLNVGGGLIVSTQTQSCPGWSTYPIYPAFHGSDLSDAGHRQQHQCSTMSLEKLLRYAQTTGELILAGRNLKEFPKHCFKYHLKDTTLAGKTLKKGQPRRSNKRQRDLNSIVPSRPFQRVEAPL